ncbi:molybdopterin synthase sulfur carrier subunit [Oceanisphaera avium]|uniref:Molybdopterin synthase sulfur carrier subunit n=1 Tax=Oceanisphaera avium TaxID=1903694 RepID=A0A1Y0CWC5_9GAMM|nr:molybdopterin synthase sulfur carrier subunit [Oceanisphaera avium]ART79518.1 molybdopterin synthase sulfur carrier subunit [Oceanisphaera avium]
MTIKVLFFAKIREQLGQSEITIAQQVATVEELRQHLVSQGEPWASALAKSQLLVGVNHQMVALNSAIQAGDEVAFFPPVTGG